MCIIICIHAYVSIHTHIRVCVYWYVHTHVCVCALIFSQRKPQEKPSGASVYFMDGTQCKLVGIDYIVWTSKDIK